MAYGIDCGINYKNFEKWNAVVKMFNYPDIKTAIISEYEKHGSYVRTAEVFDVNEITIRNKLLAFGYPKINPKGRPNEHRRKQPSPTITKGIPFVECECPKCGTKHKMKILWRGRGTPKKFCPEHKRLSESVSDMCQEIFYDWRCN